MNTIRENWKAYRDDNSGIPASMAWLIHTRRSFYAGAKAMLDIMTKAVEGDTTEEEGSQLMDDLRKELDKFFDDDKGA